MNNLPKYVLDTNIIVSAYYYHYYTIIAFSTLSQPSPRTSDQQRLSLLYSDRLLE